MKTTITTLAFLFLITAIVQAQEPVMIRGQISNGLNHMAMENCHIYLDGRVAGTISNCYGEFEIQIPQKYAGRNLNVSHLGFEVFSIPVNEIRDNFLAVNMQENPIWLAELVITPEAEEIVDTAIASVSDEFSDEKDLLIAFYEALLKKDKDRQIIRTVLAENYVQ